ncbi:MAG: protein kinase, partial [Deltaproteobacteria bacterium]|nr:protein kinase [Deltaproteobacteria bacterium]
MNGVVAEVGSTANNYQILARLATGGMAEIFLARGMSAAGVERYCVLKRILRNRASDEHFVKMFLDEARLAAQLQHANIAQVYDIGKLGDSYFFTMEYVHGETVRSVLQRARSLRREVPLASVLTVIAGAAAGLHHAHERIGIDGRPLDIVHRDVSPSNLMVGFDGGVKVVDFGVAKAADRMQETHAGTVKGKISYLSPEQCRGMELDRRSDLFSLGIVFWELLATERLYKRASDFENMTAIVNEPPPPPSLRRPHIPKEIDAIALRLLAKDPAQRFQNADQVVEVLEGAAARAGLMLSPSALGRLVRDMFGPRPEPWLDLVAEEDVPPDGVTVTSEPIPKELAIPVAADLDLRLANVPDLSRDELAGEQPESLPAAPPASQLMTAAHLDPALAPTQMGMPLVEEISTDREQALPPGPVTMLGPAAPMPYASEPRGEQVPLGYAPGVAPTIAPTVAPTVPPTLPPFTSPGGHTFPGPGLRVVPGPTGSASYPSYGSYPPQPEPASHRSWMLFGIVGAAAIVGSLTVWLATRGGSEDPPRPRPSNLVLVADAAVADAAIVIDEPVPIDAAVDARAEEPADAAPAEPPPDAAPADDIAALFDRGRFAA